MPDPLPDEEPLAGVRAVVMGLGRFGGGVGAARFLATRGARVLVTDLAAPESLAASVAALEGLDITFRLGEHCDEDFRQADLLVVNPAVKATGNRFIALAREAGAKVTSEIRLLVNHLSQRLSDRRRVVGVTGTAGKSTTTAMIGHVLARQTGGQMGPRRVHIGGNLGGSLLERLDAIRADDVVVLELSSFMLAGLDEDRWSPGLAVVSTFAANHLDWHSDVDDYRRAKQTILRHQQPGDAAILGPDAADWPTAPDVRRVVVGSSSETLPLLTPGTHNQLNAQLALAACEFLGMQRAAAAAALADFAGLPHRLQLVAERQDVRYYNDSKATTPEAAMLAMQSFAPGIVHAILGGYDKKADLGAMAQLAARRCRAVYTVGATGAAIAAAAKSIGAAEVVPCGDVDAAVAATTTRVHRGDVVLLSPGCASWDQFDNFEQRGVAFVAAVLKYVGEGSPNVRA